MLGGHNIISTSISFSGDESNFWNGGLGISVEKLCSVRDDSIILLVGSRQEPWDINESHNWDVEGVAETDESSGLN